MSYLYPTKPKRPFKRGDLVDTMNGDHTKMSTVKVVRAGPKVVATDCRRRWDQRGWWIGENGIWPFPWIRHHKKERDSK